MTGRAPLSPDQVLPKARGILRHVLGRAKASLAVKRDVASFELFGADFIVGADGRLWLCEVNRSPRQLDPDAPMIHALFDIILDEPGGTPPHRRAAPAPTPGGTSPGEGAPRQHAWSVLDVISPPQRNKM